ncbi:hypothetical protein [Pseudofrankia asymbiotica]|uniref:Uncharacterized protein n=1 Tax=Pseudofrankia asymbiotica TaxID=1834516 RepID=A0A1V2I5X0_9ACTN|nr:hypothetical protein [Pseudofrankia asymbiotica]ONH25183.1 hypothetical protein BL253_27830 [Pseudofrankia asymbiotica]
MRRFGSNLASNLSARDGRHHLGVAALLCFLELLLLVSVEVLLIHVLMAVAIFGRDVVDACLRSGDPASSD